MRTLFLLWVFLVFVSHSTSVCQHQSEHDSSPTSTTHNFEEEDEDEPDNIFPLVQSMMSFVDKFVQQVRKSLDCDGQDDLNKIYEIYANTHGLKDELHWKFDKKRSPSLSLTIMERRLQETSLELKEELLEIILKDYKSICGLVPSHDLKERLKAERKQHRSEKFLDQDLASIL
eukprot:TRINITY_DN16954_c0_g1_i1.p1 TRINITY_DN16954_c0_g1~~TRINITY_DN16954_c0_g1_i1.p1  ORF type:complete len:181 (+),score=40.46 TRINITY_DN16954_c0_g1_i1:24-545(+)